MTLKDPDAGLPAVAAQVCGGAAVEVLTRRRGRLVARSVLPGLAGRHTEVAVKVSAVARDFDAEAAAIRTLAERGLPVSRVSP